MTGQVFCFASNGSNSTLRELICVYIHREFFEAKRPSEGPKHEDSNKLDRTAWYLVSWQENVRRHPDSADEANPTTVWTEIQR